MRAVDQTANPAAWASSEAGKAAIRAGWDAAQALGMGERIERADIAPIVYAALTACGGGWHLEYGVAEPMDPADWQRRLAEVRRQAGWQEPPPADT